MAMTKGDHAVKGNLSVEGPADLSGNTVAYSGFDSPYLEAIDYKPEGVSGGDFDGQDTAGGTFAVWVTRDLTDVIWNDFATEITAGGVDIDVDDPRPDLGDPDDSFQGEFVLEAGTYYIEASAPALNVNAHVARLADTTNAGAGSAATVVLGTSEFAADTATWVTAVADAHQHTMNIASSSQTRSHIRGRFELRSQRTLEIQHRAETSQTVDGLGSAGFFYETGNIYTSMQIWLLKDNS
tara:strand:+ start:265 stop:981 length:717 start_codon:yes stop_codon:yes gene_type:complete